MEGLENLRPELERLVSQISARHGMGILSDMLVRASIDPASLVTCMTERQVPSTKQEDVSTGDPAMDEPAIQKLSAEGQGPENGSGGEGRGRRPEGAARRTPRPPAGA